MSDISERESVATSNTLATKSVTAIIINTHCIVCGGAFQQARKGKLYCSTRCKQFGYNHKDEINEMLSIREKGINKKIMIFFIDDYSLYDRKQRMLKRYRELEKKRIQWESVDQEIGFRQKLQLPIRNFTFDSYVSKKLTDEEENELCNNETELEEDIIALIPRELSLEQWSFIKSLYPSLDEISFFELVSSLSLQFLGQLTLAQHDTKGSDLSVIIKNKFINHCNLIAAGVIQFEKRANADD